MMTPVGDETMTWPRKVLSYLSFLKPSKAMTGEEVANTIDAFVDGTGGRWDWDDFISVPLSDPKLENIRREAASIPSRFPSNRANMWCSFEGIEELRALSRRIRGAKMD